MPKAKKTETAEEKFERFSKRIRVHEEAWQEVMAETISDQRFAAGHQWDEAVKSKREEAGLSSVTYNPIPSNVRFIVNRERANMPAFHIDPVSDGADKNTAKVRNGIAIHIQNGNDAKAAFLKGLRDISIGGIGAWKVMVVKTQKIDGSPEWNIEVHRILNATKVRFDPNAVKKNYSDAVDCSLESWLPKEDAEELYPDADFAPSKDGHNASAFTDDAVQVVEYWCLNKETRYWEQYILSGNEILESNIAYKGHLCPIVFITGEEDYIEDDRHFKGIVRDVREMCGLNNLAKSRIADYIARASNQQWKYTQAQIAGYEKIYYSSNLNGIPGLPYNREFPGDTGPERLDPAPAPQGSLEVAQDVGNDIRNTIGIRDPMADLPSNVSNDTMRLHLAQSNIGTLEFVDNWREGIRWTGEIVDDLITSIYSYPHIRHIEGVDGQITAIPIQQAYTENGKQAYHDLTQGKYAVSISTGPSYESSRQEAATKISELLQADPNLMQLYGDIFFRLQDWEGAEEMAARARTQVPPAALAASNATNGDEQDVQAQMGQLLQKLQQLTQQNQELQQANQKLLFDQKAKVTEIQTRAHADIFRQQKDHEFEAIQNQQKLDAQSKQIAEKGVVDTDLLQTQGGIDLTLATHEGHTSVFHKKLDHEFAEQHPTPSTQEK